ncbi:class I SAM-dependent methyltransferase [Longispora sp. K20-0274]|uniref:class I SAM-dependent methyltransferase n=1 Tax=Longispora sp. K20-0274 TaxID=3088255 RepID=UPI003999A3E2
MTSYADVTASLRVAYDGDAARRDATDKEPWKLDERAAFLDRLRTGDRLLEVGAGTGQDSVYFRDHGLDVVAVDLSSEMVALCRAKGLDAHVRDFLDLGFPPGSFDAVFAFNCLLHVPTADLPAVLSSLVAVLRRGGLLFVGVYGGDGTEGPLEGDEHDPPRFFSWRTDEQWREHAGRYFEIVDFHVRELGDRRFQSLTLRRPV